MNITNWDLFYPDLITFRQQIHAQPEIAMEEFKTAKAVKSCADLIGYDEFKEIAKPGMVFSLLPIDTTKEPQKGIMFRAELDALPIPDQSDLPYRSKEEGKGHLCGHDGHMSILLGLMFHCAQLKKKGLLSYPVHFLFQPAEENGAGAKAMLEDEHFDYSPEFIFSLHNIPGAPLGQIFHKSDVFTPEVISVDFNIMGATSHAAQPHLGVNPAEVVGEIIHFMGSLHKYSPTSKVSTFADGDVIVAPIQIEMGQADYGISAGSALVGYTFRTYRPEQLLKLRDTIESKAKQLQLQYNLNIELSWHQYFAANINDHKASELARKAFIASKMNVQHINAPFEWGEDFGNFTQKIPAYMFGIGSGEKVPPLHNQTYDFPDELIPIAVKAFLSIVYQYNKLDIQKLTL